MAGQSEEPFLKLYDGELLKSDLLHKLVDTSLYKEASEFLDKCFSLNLKDIFLNTEEISKAERWIHWARKRQHLKLVSSVIPAGILPKDISGELIDIKVFTKRGPDDAIYDNNKDIRDKVARGNCFIHIDDGKYHGTTCIIYALKKFTGGLGDDDDRDVGDNFTWKNYFSKPLEEASCVISTKKANGEAGHLSCRYIEGQFLICGGSKNVHLVFTTRADVEKYSYPRFTVAREVCSAVLDLLDQLSDTDKERLLSFLCLTGYTAIFEILNPSHQHVEDLSYLPRPELKFITWTSCDIETESESFCSEPPHIGIELAKALNLPTVSYEVLPVKDVDRRMSQIRQGYGYEGEVLYFLDNNNTVIGLLKKKTIWYIVCRAIREKVRGACQSNVKSPDTFFLSKSLHKLETRIDEIRSWLGLDEASTLAWKGLGTKFLRWCIQGINNGEVTLEEVSNMFPVLWKRYLKYSGETDRVHSEWKETRSTFGEL